MYMYVHTHTHTHTGWQKRFFDERLQARKRMAQEHKMAQKQNKNMK